MAFAVLSFPARWKGRGFWRILRRGRTVVFKAGKQALKPSTLTERKRHAQLLAERIAERDFPAAARLLVDGTGAESTGETGRKRGAGVATATQSGKSLWTAAKRLHKAQGSGSAPQVVFAEFLTFLLSTDSAAAAVSVADRELPWSQQLAAPLRGAISLCLAFGACSARDWEAAGAHLEEAVECGADPALCRALRRIVRHRLRPVEVRLSVALPLEDVLSGSDDETAQAVYQGCWFLEEGRYLLADLSFRRADRGSAAPWLDVFRLECLAGLGDYPAACEILQRLVNRPLEDFVAQGLRQHPTSLLTKVVDAAEPELADELLCKLADQLDRPDWLLKKRLDELLKRDRLDIAAEVRLAILERARRAAAATAEDFRRLAAAKAELGQVTEAEEIVVEGLARWPDDVGLWQRRFTLALVTKSLVEAKEALVPVLAATTEKMGVPLLRIALEFLGLEATKLIEGRLPELATTASYKEIVGRYAMNTGQIEVAEAYLASAETAGGSLATRILRANLEARKGNADGARQLVAGALDDPDLSETRLAELKKVVEELRDDALRDRMLEVAVERFAGSATARLGRLLAELGRMDLGMAVLTGLLNDPKQKQSAAAGLWLARFLRMAGRFAEAEALFRSVHALDPKNPDVLIQWAELKLESGELAEALRLARLGRFHSLNEDADFNIAETSAFFHQGKMQAGWRLFRRIRPIALTSFWLGDRYTQELAEWEAAPSRLLCTRSGVGDEIRWASLYPDLQGRSDGQSMITCDPRLETLFRRSFPRLRFVPTRRRPLQGDHVSISDYSEVPHADLMSIFDNGAWSMARSCDRTTMITDAIYALRPTRDSFRQTGPVFKADAGKIAAWRKRMCDVPGPRIGIAWRSDLLSYVRLLHFLPLSGLVQILSSCPGTWYVLQSFVTPEEREAVTAAAPGRVVFVSDTDDIRNDFESMAGLLSALDAVIAPATTLAELAGGLGVPTGLISRSRVVSWRQQADGHDIWFPSIRHFFVPYHLDPDGGRLAADIADGLPDLLGANATKQMMAAE